MKYGMLGGLFALSFILNACSETPEEKARNEAREECEKVRQIAPPNANQAQLQGMIDECVKKETQRKLQRANQSQSNNKIILPQDITYYLNNETERQYVLSNCLLNSETEKPSPQACDNAAVAKVQLDVYKITVNQDSEEYFFNNPNMRKKVLAECHDPFIPKGSEAAVSLLTPCTSAFNTERKIQIDILKRGIGNIEKVEDFLKNKDVISKFLYDCQRSEYVKQETICINLLEADRQWMLTGLEESSKGKSEVQYFLDNPRIMRDVNSYCNMYGMEYPFLLDNPICKNALIARENH